MFEQLHMHTVTRLEYKGKYHPWGKTYQIIVDMKASSKSSFTTD